MIVADQKLNQGPNALSALPGAGTEPSPGAQGPWGRRIAAVQPEPQRRAVFALMEAARAVIEGVYCHV